jgi:N-methylhydantoinase B
VGAGLDRNGNFVADLTGDSLNGAIGAFPMRDGVDTGGAWWWPRSKAGNAEEWESALPFIYLYRREQIDSGGAGRWRGGNGAEVGIVPHKTNDFNILIISSDPAINTSPGLAGGMPGHSGDYKLAQGTDIRAHFADGRIPGSRREVEAILGEVPRLSPKASEPVTPDSVFCLSYSAGGGFGDALDRPAASVAADVVSHRITPGAAAESYGVVLDADGKVDAAATESRRAELRRTRLAAAASPSDGDRAHFPAEAVLPVAGALGVGFSSRDASWVCTRCMYELIAVKENYKLGAAVLQRSPHDVNPAMYAEPAVFCDAPFVLREYLCPSCGVHLATECCRADDPPTTDISFTDPGLQQLLERTQSNLPEDQR